MKKLIKKVKNIIFKKKIKKDPQRLKHKVRFNIEWNCEDEDAHKSKPIIAFVQKGSISEKKFFIGDVVKSTNGIKVKTVVDVDNEINKLNWGDEVFFEVERNNKIEKVNIKTISFEHYKEHCVTWGITIKKGCKLIKIDKVGIEYNIDFEIDAGDTLIAINSEKISSMEVFNRERLKYKVGDNIKFKIKKASYKTKTVNIKLISFGEAIKINKKSCENLSKTGALLFKEWEEADYGHNHEDWQKRRDEIVKLNSEEEEPEESDYADDDYADEEKIYITTTIKKEKVAGKESFALTLDGFPDDERLETLAEGKKIFLKIYVFDVTDLDSDKYYEISDTTGLTDQYFSNNCHVIKTNEITWSDGNMNLIQSKELEPYGDHPTKLAFPYSVMLLPKVGKRKLSFRTFLCTDKQKFDDVEGRPKDGELINYRPESFKMDDYGDYGFDDYGDYPEILSYTSSEIEVEYKQPGYLDINRRKYNDLTIALGLALNQLEGKNLKENFEKIKNEIRYDGDYSAEGNIYKSLSLKSNYESALNKKIDLESILKELKKNSRIHERYEMIDLLLNLAITDQTYSAKENEFIDKVAKSLDLHNEKFQEIKKRKTASVKFVDFGDKADESIFGITKDMDKKEKLKVLRKEYSRWNALTNNSDKAIRERAREMRDLAANIRRQYT